MLAVLKRASSLSLSLSLSAAALIASSTSPTHRGMASAAASSSAQPRVSRQQVEGARGDVVVIMPAEDALHTATVVGPIHGLGDSGAGWADPAMWLASRLPHGELHE